MFDCAVQLLKVNESARLSARDSMPAVVVITAASMIADAVGKFEPVHQTLLEPSILSSLEYACEHDFVANSKSLAAQAAWALVVLVGRSETD